MSNKIITNNNNYLYNSKLKELIFLPEKFLNTIDGGGAIDKTQILYKNPYYYEKNHFLKEDWLDNKGLSKKCNYIGSYSTKEIEECLSKSRTICLEVSEECNLNCRYCIYGRFYKKNGIHARTQMMNFQTASILIDFIFEKWRKVNTDVNSEKIVSFYGGEPLLNFTLIKEIVEYIDNHKLNRYTIKYNLTTNGLLLNRYSDFLSQNNFKIMISLDGNRWNNSFRLNHKGEESYDALRLNLDILREQQPIFFKENIVFNAVLHARNSLIEIDEYFRDNYPQNRVQVSPLSSEGLCKENEIEFRNSIMAEDFSIDKKTTIEIENRLRLGLFESYSNMIKRKLNFNYHTPIDLIIDNENIIATGTCMPFEKLFITTKGEIFPCERCAYPRTFGSINQNEVNIDYDNVVNIYSQMFKRILPMCKKCHYYDICKTCLFDIADENYCPNFKSKSEMNENLTTMISDLEEFDFNL